ncbi:MAG TPA: hypothetical protein PLY56_18185, partial [Armatimonadota bacterium]|nr:hypothetical protein [Armatimonadota bacterium]
PRRPAGTSCSADAREDGEKLSRLLAEGVALLRFADFCTRADFQPVLGFGGLLLHDCCPMDEVVA